MCGIRRAIVVEDNMLLGLAALNDLMRSGAKLILDLLQNRDHERGHNGENPDRHLLLKLFEDLGQNRDFLDHLADGLHQLIVELDGGHNLLEDVLNVLGELLGVTRGNLGVLHLRVCSVILDVLHFTLLVSAKDSIRDLAKKIFDHAGVAVLVVRQSTLELVQLILGELVGNWPLY